MSDPVSSPIALSMRCPECDASLSLDRSPLRGQVIRCSDCGVELEVTSVEPLMLERAPEVEEDWGE